MPQKPPRICSRPGCRGFVRDDVCSVCGPVKRSGWQSDRERGTRKARGYGEPWQKLRKAYISQYPLCELCEAQGRTTLAEQVHHIKPFKGTEDPLLLDWENLQALCCECHASITAGRKNRRQG